jgi:hypothetical protein
MGSRCPNDRLKVQRVDHSEMLLKASTKKRFVNISFLGSGKDSMRSQVFDVERVSESSSWIYGAIWIYGFKNRERVELGNPRRGGM